MKYSIIESVFLGDYKSIVELELFTSSFFFFNGIPHPPPQHSINQALILLFFSRDGSSLVARKILGDQCIKLHFSPIILVIKISGGKKKKTFKAQTEFHLLLPGCCDMVSIL